MKIEILEGGKRQVARERRGGGMLAAYFQALKIRVTKDCKPMPDLIVDFEGKGPAPMVVQLEPSSGNISTMKMDRDGVAVLNRIGNGD